jgi:hypothetical protein
MNNVRRKFEIGGNKVKTVVKYVKSFVILDKV